MVIKKSEPEFKEASLTLRVRPSIKAMAETRAKEIDRSLANYVELLIKTDYELSRAQAHNVPVRPTRPIS